MAGAMTLLDGGLGTKPAERAARGASLVRVFEHEPELLSGLRPSDADEARRLAVARVVNVERGEWRPPLVGPGPHDLGVLVIRGLIVRRIEVVGRAGVELLGAGDLVRPWRPARDEPIRTVASVKVCEPAVLAILDRQFTATVARWPEILPALLERMTARAHALVFQLAIAQLPQLEARLLCLFWHLADRWGRVDREGVSVRLRLSGETLAELTSARRQSVSSAMVRLRSRGLVVKRGPGEFRLYGEPPSAFHAISADGFRLPSVSLAVG